MTVEQDTAPPAPSPPSPPLDSPPPAVERRRLLGIDPAWFVLGAIIAVWVIVFGQLVWRRHDRFGSYGLDLAIFDQASWLLSRGRQFMTMRGLPVFGHHANVGLLFFAPFYWLGAGPHFLNLFQVAALGFGAVPLFLLARWRLKHSWLAVVLAAAYLAHPSLQLLSWELFHPETVAIPFLFLAYWFAVRERWTWYAVSCIVAASWKEDVALAVVGLGLVLLIRGRKRAGLLTIGAAFVYFLFVTRILLPQVSGDTFYLSFYSHIGDSPLEIIANLIRHPSIIIRHVTAPDAKEYLWKMTAPFGLVPLLGTDVLLLGFPQAMANILSVNNFTRAIHYHYAALPLAGLSLAMVEGVAFFSRVRPTVRNTLVTLVAVSALMSTVSWGVSPIGNEYRKGWWPLAPDARVDSKRAALDVVPDGAQVSASFTFDSHLSHRPHIYEFPNPFKPSNWGVANENPPDPNDAHWLIVDTLGMGTEDRKIVDDLLATGQFERRFDEEGVLVAQRVRDAPR